MHDHECEHESSLHGRVLSEAAQQHVQATVSEWWEHRHELASGTAWDVPFPLLEGHTCRVTCEADAGSSAAGHWRAALIRPRALSAYIEVESYDGPIPALINLYQHVM